jgi:hypothetical protein
MFMPHPTVLCDVNPKEITTIGATFGGGIVTAVLLFVAAGNAPAVELNPLYIDLHVAVFFLLLGALIVIGIDANDAKPRLTAVYVVATGLAAAGLLLNSIADPGGRLPFVAIGVVAAGGGAALRYTGVVSKPWLYRLSGFLATSLIVFGLIYLGALTLDNQNVRYLVPLVIAVPAYLAVLLALREARPAAGP